MKLSDAIALIQHRERCNPSRADHLKPYQFPRAKAGTGYRCRNALDSVLGTLTIIRKVGKDFARENEVEA